MDGGRGHRMAAKAHVLVAPDTYTELALRCVTHDDPVGQGDAPRPASVGIVDVARYATALARELAAAGTPAVAITVEASLRRALVAGELQLRILTLDITADLASASADAGARLTTVATAAAKQWAASTAAGPGADVRVTCTVVGTVAAANTSADSPPGSFAGGVGASAGVRRWPGPRPRWPLPPPRLSVRRPGLIRLPFPRAAARRAARPRPAESRPRLPGLPRPRRPSSVSRPRALAAGAVALALLALVGLAAGSQQARALLGLSLSGEASSRSAEAATALPATATPPPPATGVATAQAVAPTGPPEPPATASPPPTRAAPAAAQLSASPVAPRLVLDQPFVGTQPRLPWPNDRDATAWLAGDGYHLLARQPGQFVAIGPPGGPHLRDVTVTATFQKVGGPLGGGYGIILRDQGPGPRDGVSQGGRYYVLEVGDRGQVGMWRREEDHWVDLVPWTATPAAHPGDAENELSAQAVGQQLSLRVNGAEAATWQDAALADGAIGVFLGGDRNEAVLKRLVVEAPS